MKTGRVLGGAIAAVVIVAVVALYLLWTNLDKIVKAAIEKYGSQVAQTAVGVSSVKIKLTTGEGAISGLAVGNPSGFSSLNAFSLGNIRVSLDTSTVTKEPIIIDEIHVFAPKVVYEINETGASNIMTIKKNVDRSIKGSSKKAPEEKKDNGKDIKLLVRSLVIDKGEVELRIAALGSSRSVKLPPFQLKNIGKGVGATPAQIAEQVLSAIIEHVGPVVADLGAEQFIGKTVDEVRRDMEREAEKQLSNELQKALGDESPEAEKALKQLLGR